MFCVHISEEQFVLPYTETRPRHSIFGLETGLKYYNNTGHGQREERNEERKKENNEENALFLDRVQPYCYGSSSPTAPALWL